MHTVARTRCALAIALCLIAPIDRAQDDLFEVTAFTTAGDPELTISSGGSDLTELVEDLIESEDEFRQLDGRAFDATLTYAGVERAVEFEANDDATDVTLTIPSTGFSRRFTGDSSDDVEDQIEDFFLEEGAEEYARFLREINERSPVAAVDGNPHASTAFMAKHAFERYALFPSQTLALSPTVNSDFRIGGSGGFIDTDVGDGSFAQAGFGSSFRFGDRVALSTGLAGQYREIEGAEAYTVATTLGLPIGLVIPEDEGLGWHVSPFLLGGASGSLDMAAGGLMGGGGVANLFHWYTDALSFSFGSQIAFIEGTDIDWGDNEFVTDVSQTILTNGGKVVWSPGEVLFVDAGATLTNFLDEAAVDDYWSPFVGVGVRFGTASGLRIGYRGDFGDDYESHGGNILLFISH